MTKQAIATPGLGRAQFNHLSQDVWRAFRWVRDRDLLLGSHDEAVAHLVHEAAARDLLARLFYALDAGDTMAAATLFTPTAIVDGRTDAAAHLQERVARSTFSRHRYTNTIVRVTASGEELWLTCYLHQARVRPSGEVDSRFSRCLARLEKGAEGWRFADWHASVDLVQRYGTAAEMEAAGAQMRDRVELDRATRAFTKHQWPLIDGGRDTWNELRDDVWEAHHWFNDQPVSPPAGEEEKLQRLVDELQIRELLSNYAFAHDSRDLAWTSSVFADDAILINDTLRFDGNAEVIEAFRGFNRRMTISFHRFSNPQIKFVPGKPEAWFIAYYHVPTIGPENRCQFSFGRYFSRLTKRSGRWQILDWRIANDPSILPMELSSEAAT